MVDLNVKVESDWGQGFKKLLEMIRLGLGKLTEAHLIRAKAEADADRITSISEAMRLVNPRADLQLEYADGPIKISAKQDLAVPLPESTNLIERSAERNKHIEIKHQVNTERILAGAAYDLKDTTEVPNTPPDEDWVSRFFSYAQEINNPEMQVLWSKILSGKIKRPETFSLRTLDCLRNLSTNEAEAFVRAAKLAIISNRDIPFIFNDEGLNNPIVEIKRLRPAERFLLGELGLLYPEALVLNMFGDKKCKEELFFSENYIFVIKRGDKTQRLHMPIFKFTEVGRDLLNLITNRPIDDEYINQIGQFFISNDCSLTIGTILKQNPNHSFEYIIIRKIDK
jgi:uncharacterized repeat protein (TIGR03899 family)